MKKPLSAKRRAAIKKWQAAGVLKRKTAVAQDVAKKAASKIWGKRGFASEFKDMEGKLIGYSVGYHRKGKTGRGLSTIKGRSYAPKGSFNEAFRSAFKNTFRKRKKF